MRTFIAIEIPDAIKLEMKAVQDRLKRSGADAGWTRAEGIHLTLKFLGEVPESEVSKILEALRDAAGDTGRFQLSIAGAGVFPNARNPRVVWLGLSGDMDILSALQARVESAMVSLGREQEDRQFTPHLTLGRIKFIRSRADWAGAMEAIKDIRLPGFEVSGVSLMKSELKPGGAVYTEMGRVELK